MSAAGALRAQAQKVINVRRDNDADARREDKFAGIVENAMSDKSLKKVLEIFAKPSVRRTEADIRVCTRYMRKNQFALKFFRTQQKSQLEALCKVMTATVCPAGHRVYNQGEHAGHAYVVVEGRVGVYLPENKEEASEYEAHMHRMRLVSMAGKLNEAQREEQSVLDSLKGDVGLRTAKELRSELVIDTTDEGTDGAGEESKVLGDREPSVASLDDSAGGRRRIFTPSTTSLSRSSWMGTDDEDAGDDGEGAMDLGAGVDRSRASSPLSTFRSESPVHRKSASRDRWKWALNRILLAMRMGRAFLDLGQQARVSGDGVKWVQARLHRRGEAFGDVDLYHPSRKRSAALWTKTTAILFMIPREQYVALHEANAELGDLSEDVTFLSSLPWLTDVPADATVSLAYHAKKIVAPRHTILIAEGTSDAAIFCIKRGNVRVECRGSMSTRPKTLGLGLPYQLGLIGEGQWFGEKPCLTGLPNDFSFVADSYCVILVISAQGFFPHRRRVLRFMLDNLELSQRHRTKRLAQAIKATQKLKAMTATEPASPSTVSSPSPALPASSSSPSASTPALDAGSTLASSSSSSSSSFSSPTKHSSPLRQTIRILGGTVKAPVEYATSRPNAAVPLRSSSNSLRELSDMTGCSVDTMIARSPSNSIAYRSPASRHPRATRSNHITDTPASSSLLSPLSLSPARTTSRSMPSMASLTTNSPYASASASASPPRPTVPSSSSSSSYSPQTRSRATTTIPLSSLMSPVSISKRPASGVSPHLSLLRPSQKGSAPLPYLASPTNSNPPSSRSLTTSASSPSMTMTRHRSFGSSPLSASGTRAMASPLPSTTVLLSPQPHRGEGYVGAGRSRRIGSGSPSHHMTSAVASKFSSTLRPPSTKQSTPVVWRAVEDALAASPSFSKHKPAKRYASTSLKDIRAFYSTAT